MMSEIATRQATSMGAEVAVGDSGTALHMPVLATGLPDILPLLFNEPPRLFYGVPPLTMPPPLLSIWPDEVKVTPSGMTRTAPCVTSNESAAPIERSSPGVQVLAPSHDLPGYRRRRPRPGPSSREHTPSYHVRHGIQGRGG